MMNHTRSLRPTCRSPLRELVRLGVVAIAIFALTQSDLAQRSV